MKISAVSGSEIMGERDKKMQRSLWSIKAWLFAMIMSIGMVLGMSAAQAEDISGTIYNDVGGSLSYNAKRDFPVEGVTVTITNASNASDVKIVVTGANGTYTATGLTAGYSYKVAITGVPTGYAAASGESTVVLSAGGSTGNNLAVRGAGGSIAGTVFEDANLNLVLDGGEGSFPNIRVYLKKDGVIISEIDTLLSGYVFNNLPSGVGYTVEIEEEDLSGYALIGTTDSTVNSPKKVISVASVTSPLTGKSFAVTELNTGGIQGYVINDIDRDNAYNDAYIYDLPVSGAMITLYYGDGVTPVPGVTAVASNADGTYKLSNVPLWKGYKIKVSNLPTNFTSTGTVAGTTAPLDTITMDITTKESAYGANNFFIQGTESRVGGIKGSAFIDLNFTLPFPNASTGMTTNNPDANDSLLTGVLITLKKDGADYLQQYSKDGAYHFVGIPAGNYEVVADLTSSAIPSGYRLEDDYDGSRNGKITQVVASTTVNSRNFWWITDGSRTGNLYSRAGYVTEGDASSRWSGRAENGVTVSGDGVYISGTFQLFYLDGTPASATFTATKYGFSSGASIGVPAMPYGRYLLRSLGTGTPVGWNSNGDVNVKVSSTGSVNNYTYNFLGEETKGISGRIFVDASDNDSYDSGEGLGKVIVRLYDANGTHLAVRVTDSDGNYAFYNLPLGQYRVEAYSFANVDAAVLEMLDLTSLQDNDGLTSEGILNLNLTTGGLTERDIWVDIRDDLPRSIQGKVHVDSYGGFGATAGNNQIDTQVASYISNPVDFYLKGTTVSLYKDAIGGTPVASIVTGADGAYKFDNLEASTTYYVVASAAGYTAITNLSQDLPGDTHTVAFGSSIGLDEGISRNFLMKGEGQVTGTLMIDYDGDGEFDSNEAANGNVGTNSLYIWDTDLNDWRLLVSYSYQRNDFFNLGPGTYQIRKNFSQIYVNTVPTSTDPQRADFTITNSEAHEIYFFAATPNGVAGGLTGTLRIDSNGDGVINSSDLPLTDLSGVTVEFYRTHQLRDSVAAGQTPTPVYTATVNADGTYSAPGGMNISPPGMGNFILKIVGLPSEYTLVNDADGAAAPVDSDLGLDSPLGAVKTVIRNALISDVDFLVKTDTKIYGRVYQDVDYNSEYASDTDTIITGRVISLYDSTGTTLLTSQTVSSTGEYQFTSLPVGDYVVKIDGTPTGMVIAGGSANTWNVSLSTTTPSVEKNFWFNLDGDAGIAGSVMIDVNNNGDAENAYDFPLKNVTVTLYESDGVTPVSVAGVANPTTTNSRGAYKFIGIPTGTYVVDISTLVSDYSVYKTYNGLSAPQVTTSKKITVAMPSKAMYTDRIFLLAGNSNPDPGGGPGGPSSEDSGISGYLYIGTSVSHPAGTAYLANVDMILTDSDGNSVTTKTDANGYYQFYNLAAGTYTVALVSNPSGYSVVGDVDGSPLGKITATAVANVGTKEQNMWFISVSEKGVTGKVTYSPTQSATASATDVPISGLTVELYDAANPTGTALYTSITGADGKYSFPGIPTMNYIIKINSQEKTDGGYIDLNPATGQIAVTVPTAGVENQNFILGGIHSLSGKIGIDSNGDDAIDVNSANVHTKVTWYGSDGVLGTADDVVFSSDSTVAGAALRATGQTNTTGDYSYVTLPNGNYKIEALDSTLTATGVSLITTITGNTNPRTQNNVTTDQTDINFIYGYVGSISGTVVIDVDRSASSTEADQIMNGPTLTIRLEESSNPANFKTLTTTDGTFSFDGVDPTKTWKVSVSSGIATGYTFSFGLGDSNNSTAGNEYATVALTTTSSSKTGVVLGYKGSGKIQGKVVMDNVLTDGRVATSADTSLGANIKVEISSTATGFTSWTVDTAGDGSYEITDLAPYAYTISIDKAQSGFQAGLIESFDPDSTEVAPTPPTGDGTAVVTLTSPTQVLTQKDFGYKGRGSISGKVLIDVEGGGTKTEADIPFGTAITVTATQGTITRTTTANASTGEYSFDTIPTGIWQIYVTASDLPTGYSFSYGEGSPSTAIEVGADRVNVDINSALASRATVPTLRAIEVNLGYKGSAKIGGRLVYDNDDTDGAGYVSSIDTLFGADYTVTLSGGTGFTSRTVKTNVNGEYEFTGLTTYADYTVTITSPTGYVTSFDPDSLTVVPPATPVGDGEAIIPITSATEVKTLQDFGFKGTGKIAGKIYTDLNDNGAYNTGVDQPKSGIVVTLTHATLPTRTATTDANGDYVVTGVAAGEWTVEVTGGLSGLRSPSFDYDDLFDPAGTPSTPNKAVVQLTTGSPIVEDANFGYINRGKLSGVIKEDTLANGLYDPSAAGISGVTVHLVENDGITPKTYADGSPVILTTDANGYFVVRNLDCPTSGATYSIRVEFGPNATGPLNLMEPSYDSDVASAGYGSGVDLTNGRHVVNADLTAALAERTPADLYLGYRQATGDIVIHKVAGKSTAKIGDIVPYTITIENRSEAPALNVTIEDLIPAGFKYVEGSSRLDGVKIEDPKGNRPLRFEEIDLGGSTGAGAENSKRKLSYFLVVGSGVTQGEYTNSAVAKDQFNRGASNVSQATVEITSDPLFDDSLIFGKVYIDSNGNGEQDAEEEGLGGVKLATGRGEIITTDEHGRYHIPAVDGGRWERGRNFILKLDVRSLPAGYKVIGDNPIVVRTSPGLPSKINFRVKEIEIKDSEMAKE